MPPAHTSACGVCGAPSSKYTCPYCSVTTCTFDCFSKHKSSRVCTHARTEHATPKPGPPRSLLRQGQAYDYVSMKDYTYNNLVQDYQFLSDIGRMVSQTGRSIAGARMMPSAQGPQQPRTAAQHRREHLSRQLAARKLPIMLLPDGMSRRAENRTSWDGKKSLLTFTVSLAFPRARRSDVPALAKLSSGSVLHNQPSTSDLFRIAMDELEQTSAALADQSLAQWSLGHGNAQKRRRTAADDARTTWRISRQLLEQIGLAIPPGTLEAGVYHTLPDDAVLLMRIYPSRLRNESTPRFLEWWHRKGAAQDRDERHERMAHSGSHSDNYSGPIVPLHVLDNVSRLAGTDAPEEEVKASTRTLVRVATGGSADSIPIEETLRRLPLDYGIVEFPELELWPKQSMLQAERKGEIYILILHPKASPDEAERSISQPDAAAATLDATQAEHVEHAEHAEQSQESLQSLQARQAEPTQPTRSAAHAHPANHSEHASNSLAPALVTYASSDEE
ncbi:Box C/D snoRNA accumulation [Malassezia cuniculi]|uniref:Box C/D snoRNA accumulation n=1 Tax=Malassezia cuniculi TaxID=948313 RepID=A0AAF0J7U1_9BASI|nr:Box C/D snoRNA accumulation [Malassezia cuniculi]